MLIDFYRRALPEFALQSESVNGTDFTAGAGWAFGTGNFTVEFWYKSIGNVDGATFVVLKARGTSGNQSGWEARIVGLGSTKTMRLALRPVAATTLYDSVSLNVNDGVWAHYAFSVDKGSNLVTYYLNGVSQGTTDISAGAGSVGTSGSGRSILLNIYGAVDELRLWNSARTGPQILANYLTAFANPSAVSGLLADFQCNEGTGTTTTDGVAGAVATLRVAGGGTAGASFTQGPL